MPLPRCDDPLDRADDAPLPVLLGAPLHDLRALEQARIANIREPLLQVDVPGVRVDSCPCDVTSRPPRALGLRAGIERLQLADEQCYLARVLVRVLDALLVGEPRWAARVFDKDPAAPVRAGIQVALRELAVGPQDLPRAVACAQRLLKAAREPLDARAKLERGGDGASRHPRNALHRLLRRRWVLVVLVVLVVAAVAPDLEARIRHGRPCTGVGVLLQKLPLGRAEFITRQRRRNLHQVQLRVAARYAHAADDFLKGGHLTVVDARATTRAHHVTTCAAHATLSDLHATT